MRTKQRNPQMLSLAATVSPHAQILDRDDATDTRFINYVQLLMHILSISQSMCEQTHKVVDLLCKEVASITQGRAQLFLRYYPPSNRTENPFLASAISFPVQFHGMIYGALYVDPTQPVSAGLPLTAFQLLAQICGCLLYAFELSMLLQGQHRQLPQQTYGSLTKREREVLMLMYRGYDQKAIAKELCIAPTTVCKHRQQIYKHLDVHCEHDAVLAAYQAGCFSPLEEISSEWGEHRGQPGPAQSFMTVGIK